MPTSQAMLILNEVEHSKPISAKTRAFQHRRLQNRFQRFLLRTFRQQHRKTGLIQKALADRIDSRPEQVNRWLSIPGNLTLNTICDLLLGMGVDLDDPSATPLADLAAETDQKIAPQEIQKAANSYFQMSNEAIAALVSDIGSRSKQPQANSAPQRQPPPSASFAGVNDWTPFTTPLGRTANERRASV